MTELHDDEDTATLRRLIHNAERLTRGPATAQQDAIEESFKRYQEATAGLSDKNDELEGFETGAEEPVIGVYEPPRPRPGQRAALTGRNFFGVRGLVIGGSLVGDLTLVNSRRLEFTVPTDASSTNAVLVYDAPDYTAREPEMELAAPSIERPEAK
jgi:hypothetical protein